jgi:hypothetical protein
MATEPPTPNNDYLFLRLKGLLVWSILAWWVIFHGTAISGGPSIFGIAVSVGVYVLVQRARGKL